MSKSELQKVFVSGALPNPLPNGQFTGHVDGYTGTWLGKKFDAANSSGINLFNDGKGGVVEKYPFKTYTGPGVRDPGVQVLKIDYRILGNPFWLKPVLDEVVEVAPGEYLGKLQVNVLYLFPITFKFFSLKKSQKGAI